MKPTAGRQHPRIPCGTGGRSPRRQACREAADRGWPPVSAPSEAPPGHRRRTRFGGWHKQFRRRQMQSPGLARFGANPAGDFDKFGGDSGEFHDGRSPTGAECSARQSLTRFSGQPRFGRENWVFLVSREKFSGTRKKFFISGWFRVSIRALFSGKKPYAAVILRFGLFYGHC